MSERISSYNIQTENLQHMMRLQSKLSSLQTQIATGQRFENYAEMSQEGAVERLLTLDTAMKRTKQYQQQNNFIEQRLLSIDGSMERLTDIAGEVRNMITLQRTPTTGDSLPIEQMTNDFLRNIKDALNVQYNGRYLMSGSKTNQAAVGDISISNNAIDPHTQKRVTTSRYYQGDDMVFSVQSSDDQAMEYGVNANAQAFQTLIASVHLAKEANASHNTSLLDEAMDAINKAISEISTTRSEVNNNIKQIQDTNLLHEAKLQLFTKDKLALTETDFTKATTELVGTETTLKASLQIVARLMNLHLVDYLN